MNNRLIELIELYEPVNEQERADKLRMLELIRGNEDILSRNNKDYHITVSAWVVNTERTKVLMAFHNIYNSWAWLGGHADGEDNLLLVAIKEAKEESGVEQVIPLTVTPASIEILTVNGHEKNGEYVSSHLHMNFTYILEVDENSEIHNKPDENSSVAWIPLEEVIKKSDEIWIRDRIYPKLITKTKNLPNGYLCPVCNKYTFAEFGDYDICDECGWENDYVQGTDIYFEGGANKKSLKEAIFDYRNRSGK